MKQICILSSFIRKKDHWIGKSIAELQLSAGVIGAEPFDEKENAMIPYGNLVLRDGDHVFLYTHRHIAHATDIKI